MENNNTNKTVTHQEPDPVESPTYSIVIPVYKEAGIIKDTINSIVETLEPLAEPYELILVDDGSPDNTWDVLLDCYSNFNMVRLVRLSRNFGKEAALSAGLDKAAGLAVITLDGDMQHPPDLIPEMVAIWKAGGVDLVEAIKKERGNESLINRVGAGVFYYIISRLSGFNLDNATDFKLMDRKVVDAWLEMKEYGLFFRGMSAWMGFRRVRLSFTVEKRSVGTSGWSVYRLFKLALSGITSFSSFPLHIITGIGFTFFIFAVLIGIQTLYMKFSGNAVSGFTTVILLLLLIGSLIMTALGIIGIYISRIYDEVKKRPRYLIAESVHSRFNSEK